MRAGETRERRKILAILAVLFMQLPLSVAATGPGSAQYPMQQPPSPSVGANDLFAALTQPDRQAEIGALRSLRQSLEHAPDQKALDAARTQLDALLRMEDRGPGEAPPALVMSSIASRIETAIAGLEQARREAPPPRLAGWLGSGWLLAGLAGAAGTLAVALAAALVALAGRGGLDEAQEETREALSRLRRQFEALTEGLHTTQGRADSTFNEACAAARDAANAMRQLHGASKDAQTRLLGCIAEAEVRLQAASSFDQTADWLHERLVAAVDGMEERGLRLMEAAAAELAGGAAILTTEAATAAEMHQQIAGGTEKLAQALAGATGSLIAAAGQLQEQMTLGATALDARRSAMEDSADAVARAAHQAASCTTRLTEAVTAFALPAETASLLQAAHALQDHGLAIAEAAAVQARVESDARTARESHAARFASVLEGLLDRAHAVLGALPAEASAVAAMVAQLRGDTAALCQAAERIEQEAASEANAVAASAESMLGVLRAACVRLEDVAAGLGGAGASIRQDAAALRDETRQARATADRAGDAHLKAA